MRDFSESVVVPTGRAGSAVFETRVVTPDEFAAYRVLMSMGFDFTVKAVRPEARRRGRSSPDLFMEGALWELKCPRGGNPKKTIGRNVNKAARQMGNAEPRCDSVNIVLSALSTPLPADNVLFHARQSVAKGLVDNLLVIAGETRVVRMRSGDSHCPSLADGGVSPHRE